LEYLPRILPQVWEIDFAGLDELETESLAELTRRHNKMLELYLLATATLLVSYFYARLNYVRFRQYAHIPQLLNHLLWGHLKIFDEFIQRGICDRHPGML
jgi:hypothetical protein